MKVKRILRFYYSAESLDKAIDDKIAASAFSSGDKDGAECAERICALIGDKCALAELWSYVDGVITAMPERDGEILKEFARMRCGFKNLDREKVRDIKRAAIKFVRRAVRIESYSAELGILGKYCCLLS